MLRKILIAILLFTSTLSFAQYPGYALLTDQAAFKDPFMTASKKMVSLQSDFIQEKNLSMLSEKIVSKGKFWFKRDNMVRMEYEQPFQYIMVLNKGNIYIRDGQRENKVSAKSNKLFQQINQIMIDCTNGSALDNPNFDSKIFEGKTGFLIELTPRSKTLKDLFQHINIVIDKKDYTASEINMNEPGGDNTIIHFTNKQLNTNLPDALFAIH
ncbi:MAG: outer membrane lipoprotein carrier protein LolA [Bacteroidetes bacterium]|nr:MAG: outer membrane lipoprotein carrier protein LolA [Bacteroidota bacterium]